MSGVLKSGELFAGRYLIEGLIAEGGMASIYRAQDEQSGRYVAVKVLYPYYSENEIIRQRFVEEGNIQKSLGHPNVVLVNDVVLDPLAIIMEHVEGPTLDDYLAERGQLPEDEILDIIIPVMSALGLAHSKGIIHRDLKPSNILLARLRKGFQPKVMDFGVAKVKDAKHNLTATGTTVGTLHYMSPEQIVGSKHIDGRADIYSLGVTLYKLATGEVPFNAPTEFALMMAQVEAPPLPPSKLRPDLSPQLEDLILRAMAKKPLERFQTIRQFTTALLEMRRGADRTVRDTITETISKELLDFAMAANEVAQDRTAEMSVDVIRQSLLSSTEDLMEPTIEMQAAMKPNTGPTWNVDETSQESTVELTASDIVRLATIDSDRTDNDNDAARNPSSQARTDVLTRRAAPQDRVTRPSGPVYGLPGTESLVSESIETNSMSRRVSLDAGRVVVLDHDADSRDMTVPKMRDREFQKPLPLPRPSGPKVVLGYNPADTEDKTFEKPNFRTKLPNFETSKSSDDDNPFEQLRQLQSSERRPSTRPEDRAVRPGPSRPGSSILERIDLAAQSAMQTAHDRNLPAWLVIAGVFSIFVIVGCVLLVLSYWVFA